MSTCWSDVVPAHGTQELVDWLRGAHGSDPNILGLGFGHAEHGGGRTETLAAVVIVRHKRALDDERIRLEIPPTLFGLRTDVVEGGPAPTTVGPLVSADERLHRGGGRIDIDRRPWGTMGCTVSMKGPDGMPQRAVLANAHVIVPPRPLVPLSDQQVAAGPRPREDVHEAVTVYDDHRLARRRRAIATLSRYVPLVPLEAGFNMLDGAAARVTAASVGDGIAGVGRVDRACTPAEVRLGMEVRKCGAASAVAAPGRVRLLRTTYVLRTGDYGLSGSGSSFVFAEQVVAEVHQIGGDSGSVMVDVHNRAVGLVHARHPEGWAVAAPAWTVEQELGVRFGDPAVAHPGPPPS